MRRSVLFRSVIGSAAFAVAAVAIAYSPASAAVGRWDGYREQDFEVMAFKVCAPGSSYSTHAAPSIDDIQYAQSGDQAETVLISASVDTDGRIVDGSYDYDATCTFAAVGTTDSPGAKYASNVEGTYTLTVSSPADQPQTKQGPLHRSYEATTAPVFTDVDEYATATLTALGHHVTSQDGMVTIPATPKTQGQLRKAKKVYDARMKKAKSTYKKATKKASAIKGKSKRNKAKKKATSTYKRQVYSAKQSYAGMIAPGRSSTVPGAVDVRTPFSLTVRL